MNKKQILINFVCKNGVERLIEIDERAIMTVLIPELNYRKNIMIDFDRMRLEVEIETNKLNLLNINNDRSNI